MQQNRKWFRWVLLVSVVMALAAGGAAAVYYYVMTAEHPDTDSLKPDYTFSAMNLLEEFKQNDKVAQKKYEEKIIRVSGRVSSVNIADTSFTIQFNDPQSKSYLIFDFEPEFNKKAGELKPGDSVVLQGSCSGSAYVKILKGYTISFKRTAIVK